MKKIYPLKVGKCKQCDSDIIAKNSSFNKPNRVFCSRRCRTIWQNKNIPQSQHTRNLASIRAKKLFSGIPKTIEHRKKLSIRFKGNRSHFWKGGLTDQNRLLRNSFESNLWKKSVLVRDNWTCQSCNIRDNENANRQLTTHHIKSWAMHKDERFNVDNGITLCKECHKKTKNFASHYQE